MQRRTRFLALLALALAMGGGLGCGTNPAAPPSSSAPGSSSAGATAPSGLTGTLTTLIGLDVETANVVGAVGGTLGQGRWRLDIPACAIEGTATVLLGVSSPDAPTCQLDILPYTKNSFAVPVTLTADCPGVPDAELSTYVIYWFNPDSRTWVPVPDSKVDLVARTVSAPLDHFSQYGVGGKASW